MLRADGGGSRGASRERQRNRAALVLCAVIVLSAPVGLVARSVFGEPYPWLFQPSFGYVLGEEGTLELGVPSLSATTLEGDELQIDIATFMPETRTNPNLLFVNNFSRDEVVRAPNTAVWVERRLADVFPGRTFLALTVTWGRQSVDLTSGDRADLPDPEVITIELSTGGGS